MSAPSVVVVGAGMAGLAAAWRLTQAGAEVVVLERDDRVGGRVWTRAEQGFVYEAGAGFMANFYGRTLQLAQEVGLGSEVLAIGGAAAVLRGGRPRAAWPAAALLRGLRGGGVLTAGEALSLARLAAPLVRYWPGLDLHAIDQACFADRESAADYARRRLGRGVLDYLIEPPLGGLLYWTPEGTSVAMLLISIRAGIGMRRLLTLRGGLGTLPAAIASKLDVRLDANVRTIRPGGAGHEVTFRTGGRKRRLVADAIVCATPAHVARQVIEGLDPSSALFLDSVHYAPTVVAHVAVRRRLPGRWYGLLFPSAESEHLGLAAVASGAGLPHRAGAGIDEDLLSLYASGAGGRRLLGADDRDVVRSMVADLRRAGAGYDPGGDVSFERIHRWQAAVPEFPTGHLCRVGAFLHEAVWPARLAFAGDYLGGPSIEGAVTSGLRAADRILAELGLPPPAGAIPHRPAARRGRTPRQR